MLAAPTRIVIEMTNRCNSRCPFCAHTWKRAPDQDMPWPLFQQVVDEVRAFSPAPKVYLYGVSEPLLYPRVREALAHTRGLWRGFSSNGQALTERAAAMLLDAGLDEMILSVDSDVPEDHARLRVGLDHAAVMRNVLRFLELRAARRDFLTRVYVSMMHFAETDAYFAEMGARWLGRVRGMPNTVVQMKQACRFPTVRAQAMGGSPAGGFAGMLPMTSIRARREEAAEIRRNPQLQWVDWMESIRANCTLWDNGVTVLPDGSVSACCHGADDDFHVGRVTAERGVLDAWRGERWQAYRAKFNAGDFAGIPLCEACP